jgi:hypothetical protein
VPGVVVIHRDGRIVYRQVAATKDDRISAREILATADRTLGTSGSSPVPARPAIDRVHVRLDLGGAAVEGEAQFATALGVYLPLSRYFLAGAEVRQQFRDTARYFADGVLGVRLPIYGDIAALQLVGMAGASLNDGDGYFGGRLGVWFAWTPTWALQTDLGVAASNDTTAVMFTFGVSRLFGR